jgi:predicted phosphate transport protein (TIGR00153 family)
VLEWLMPKGDRFFDDFDAQCRATVEGTRLLHALLTDLEDIPVRVREIKDVEHRGDSITHAAFIRLNQHFITPFDRAQMHRLLSGIDDVLDLTDAAASRLSYYEISQPLPDCTELARLLVDCALKVQEVVNLLREMKKREAIFAGCDEIKALESQADEVLRLGVAKLFKSGVDPLTVMKWKEIYDIIETATDKCQTVANLIEGVVLEHA